MAHDAPSETSRPAPPPPPVPHPWARARVLVPLASVVAALVVGAAAGGLGAALILGSLVVLPGAVWHLATGRAFVGAPGRGLGAGLLAISLVAFGVGSSVAAPTQQPAGTAGPSTTAPSKPPKDRATPTPTPTPTPEDLADPDDPALNAAAAADLAAPVAGTPTDTEALLAAAEGQTALVALAQLVVNDQPSWSGYERDLFGYRAVDLDRNGCDTRNDVLRRDLTGVTIKPGTNDCVVVSGTLADPYSGTTIPFTRGTASSNDVQIDHVVALGDAWASGASAWAADQRQRLGNDPLNLLAVSGPLNAQKGDAAADGWLPPNATYRCDYVARQVGVKLTYGLTVTSTERAAMAGVLAGCPEQPLPAGATLPVAVVHPTPEPAAVVAPAAPAPPAPAPVVAPAAPAPPAAAYYKNCDAARAAGVAPILVGQPGYRGALDRDKDGIACE